MIEKIFIPTVHRVDNQITYNNLPKDLQRRIVFVVQAWERDQYKYDAEYLVLPNTKEYHYSDYYCLARTRKLIYEHGRNIKYAMLDDDVRFYRRNLKYFGQSSNMERSKRLCDENDLLEMFELYDNWLSEEDVTVCGCSFIENHPGDKIYRNNASLSSALWINGSDFEDILDDLDLTCVRIGEDILFLLTLLSRGYGNRVSNEFVCFNTSVTKKTTMSSTVWDNQSYEDTLKDYIILEQKFPNVFKILRDSDGKQLPGGVRDFGKMRTHWSRAYRSQMNQLRFKDD
jgi:hypothetical protein